jgi:capsular exopolysaccharide synthesis family protein
MGRTHEALERAEKDYLELMKTSPGPALGAPKSAVSRPVSSQNGREYYQTLKANLLTLDKDKTIRTIAFCATAHGEGATTTALYFAATLAKDFQSKVLVVDANLRTPRLHDICKIDLTPGLQDYVHRGKQIAVTLMWNEFTNLYVMPSGLSDCSPINLYFSNRFDEFLQEMRERFDYIILDGPPIPRFPELRVMCTKVDGVILVIKAGHTRRQVALRAKKEIEDAGGKILGVVINRRKYYIPEWIYKRL